MGLRDDLRGMIPEPVRMTLPNSYDVIGDIAIITPLQPLPSDEHMHRIIADALTARHHNIVTVLAKTADTGGPFRTAGFTILSGEETVTTHHEYGCRYRLDLRETFFSPRLGYERQRIATMIQPGERVLVPFCGVGPFVVPAAKRGAQVVALEKNARACRWLLHNLHLNKVYERVDLLQADAFAVPQLVRGTFSRAILPAPYGLNEPALLSGILPGIVPGGCIHLYTFGPENNLPERETIYHSLGLEIRNIRRCGYVAPAIARWAVDLKKRE